MQITQNILEQGLLSELAYMKLENEYWTSDIDENGIPDKDYSNYNDMKTFLDDNPKSTTGIDDTRDAAIFSRSQVSLGNAYK